jgi:hypothetical protein
VLHRVLALLCVLSACGTLVGVDDYEVADNGPGSLEALAVEFMEEIEAGRDTRCDCWEEYEYDSRRICDRRYTWPRACNRRAFFQDPEGSRRYLECMLPLQRGISACLAVARSCEAAVLCETETYEEEDACGLPDGAWGRARLDCLGQQAEQSL